MSKYTTYPSYTGFGLTPQEEAAAAAVMLVEFVEEERDWMKEFATKGPRVFEGAFKETGTRCSREELAVLIGDYLASGGGIKKIDLGVRSAVPNGLNPDRV